MLDVAFSNSLIIHEEKTKEITTVREVWKSEETLFLEFDLLLVTLPMHAGVMLCLSITFTAPTTASEPRQKILSNVVCRVKKGNCPDFTWNLLIIGLIFLFLIMKRFNLSAVWLLVEIIVLTVVVLYVFPAASLRSKSIMITGHHNRLLLSEASWV